MRPCVYSSFYLVQCVRRLCTRSEVNAITADSKPKRNIFKIYNLVKADLYINKKLGNNESIEDSHWGKVRKEILQTCQDINQINVDSQVYDICTHYHREDQGINYFKFLQRNKYPLNLATMTTYLKLMNAKYNKSGVPLTKDEEKSIIKVYSKIKEEYEILDPRSAVYCIAGISLTSMWEESLKLLEMIKFLQEPTSKEISMIIDAAFRNNRADVAWNMIDETFIDKPLSLSVYKEHLNYCKRNFKGDELLKEIEKIFLLWQKYNVIPKKLTIQEYEEFFKSVGYTTAYTSITTNGICKHCSTPLQPTILTKADFKVLSKAILNNLIIGKDVYRNTSPQELKKYLIFLQTMKPYDVIIDGLNVAYATRGVHGKGSIRNILQIVKYFHKKRVLVVGRLHMKWWSTNEIKTLEDIADVFYIKNISQDDPFLLHLTLSSGPETCFVSRDFMRQHKFKLEDPVLRQLFKNWQMSHQYFFYPVPERKYAIQVVEPMQYDPCAQKSGEGWHIPYENSDNLFSPAIYTEPPRHWLCMKYEKQKKS